MPGRAKNARAAAPPKVSSRSIKRSRQSVEDHHPRRRPPTQQPRRRHHHHQTHNSNNKEKEEDLNQEILEQLQRQRLQQQEQQRHEAAALRVDEGQASNCNKHEDPSKEDRDIRLPVARKNQFPFQCIGANPSLPMIQSSVLLSHPVCADPVTRRRLVSLMCTRRLLRSGRTLPSAIELQSGHWLHLFAPMLGDDMNDDLYGLMHKPPWIRTFDVWPYSHDNREPPQIISTGSKGFALRDVRRAKHFSVTNNLSDAITCRYRALPTDLCPENRASIVVGLVARETDRTDMTGTFRVDYAPSRHSRGEAMMQVEHPMVNDVCIVCVGFRNGQLVVTDIWGNTQAATSPIQQQQGKVDSFGSIYALTSLGSKQMLARGSSGTCRLFDLRKLSSNPTISHEFTATNPSVVTEYVAPTDQISERLTRKCRGIATDPSQSTVFSPLVSKDEVPSLGMWSLHTGEYVGSRPLAPHPDSDAGTVVPSASSWGVSWVELCSRVTPAWEKVHGQGQPRRRPGSFALWYKTGMSFAGPSFPDTAGKIHQAVFDGHTQY
eukprot:scaffold2209_cov168-Amphora_coffeaeformis.AAC.2